MLFWQVIQLVRVHRHHYNVDLGLGHYGDLLSIRYRCDSLSLEKEALDCIRAIKNVSREDYITINVLHTVHTRSITSCFV